MSALMLNEKELCITVFNSFCRHRGLILFHSGILRQEGSTCLCVSRELVNIGNRMVSLLRTGCRIIIWL